ncbi:MAG: Wzz/FepE/Etk N-terminal domain-containing protein [Terracidiphilus sp.]|jgi:polysaccharide chain length determinant protein (PEP-CTERM system associated)
MAAVTEEQNSEPLDLQRYLSVVRRRHIHFLIPMLLGWLVVWGASWVLPARYKSSTMILVEQPTMPKNYVEPNVSDDLQDRLQSITQQILSRTRLLLIIDKLHLYGERREKINPDEKVALMTKDIDIELVRNNNGEKITAFSINYSARDPHIAQQVTSELTDLFINENLKVRQQESEDTTQFIASQLENARASLAEQEAKVREFQGQHEGALPSQQGSNLQILSGLQEQLQNEADALNTAKQQRVYLQSLIEEYRGFHGAPRTADGTPTGLLAIDQELDRLRAKLADLSSHYTDRYPDVQSVKDQIAKTEKRRDDLVADMKNKGNGSRQPNDGTATRDVVDASQGSPALQLQGQLQANQSEIASREQSIAGLKARINDYQARLNEEPAVEQQLADLTRGYDQSKADYDELLKKKNESEMATNMEQMQQGERFSMLDPPSLPMKPDFPNRLKFCGIGLGVGLALGLIVAGGFEFLDDRLYSEKEIKTLLPVAVISEVPEIPLPSDERRSMRRTALGWSMTALVVATILAGSAFNYFHD